MCSQTEHAKMFVKSVQNRRHVMATDETPSAEAVTRAYTTQETCQAARHTITGMCAHCVALALDTFARERAAAELKDLLIAFRRADGALADAATVPTGNLECGIRMLTSQREALRATLAEQRREINMPGTW